MPFSVVAIPLNRPDIVDFLLPPRSMARGALLQVVKPRPTFQAETAWLENLENSTNPTITDLLAIDNPHGYLVSTHTDRLVPAEFLTKPDYLTRNPGGWAAIYFNVVGLPTERTEDVLLNHAEILTDYGQQIHYFGANPNLVAARLEEETGYDCPAIVSALGRLFKLRQKMAGRPTVYIDRLYTELVTGKCLASATEPSIPKVLLFDQLLGCLVELELDRRAALAQEHHKVAKTIQTWQQTQQQKTGLRLILKGEYIVGRHRSSIVLIAPELGLVVKQPGPESFHEIELGARVVNGKQENWPYSTRDGSLVTPRGRLRLIIEEGLVPRLCNVFSHKACFSTLMGLTMEPFVQGQTVQEWVLEDPRRLTLKFYEEFVIHQQVCEALGVENGDWHAANFIIRDKNGEFVHIDWGAARPLRKDELTLEGRLARLNQVQNISFSFHNQEVAAQVLKLHAELIADKARLKQIRQCAQAMAKVT